MLAVLGTEFHGLFSVTEENESSLNGVDIKIMFKVFGYCHCKNYNLESPVN